MHSILCKRVFSEVLDSTLQAAPSAARCVIGMHVMQHCQDKDHFHSSIHAKGESQEVCACPRRRPSARWRHKALQRQDHAVCCSDLHRRCKRRGAVRVSGIIAQVCIVCACSQNAATKPT